ncbi:MAG: hypothetical protein ACFE92_08980 [Promethearchaeota archaeon]
MIVIFCDNIDDFCAFLQRRIMNEIFFEIKEVKNQSDLSSNVIAEIIIHFLAKVSDTLILYETKQNLTRSRDMNNEKEVIHALNKVFHGVDQSLTLIKGKIREVFISYSS